MKAFRSHKLYFAEKGSVQVTDGKRSFLVPTANWAEKGRPCKFDSKPKPTHTHRKGGHKQHTEFAQPWDW